MPRATSMHSERPGPPRTARLRGPQFVIRVDSTPPSWDVRVTRWLRNSWSWLISGGLHGLATLLLMICYTSVDERSPEVIFFSQTHHSESEQVQPRALGKANFGVLTSSTRHSVSDGGRQQDVAARAPGIVAPAVGQGLSELRGPGSGPTDEARSLVAAHDKLFRELGQRKRGTRFFGIQAKGNRFVFVVDSSGSMKWAKWRRACRELVASVESLGPHQSFCVFFFDSSAHLMFNQRPNDLRLIRATPRNITRLRRWMASIHFGNDTRPYTAVRFAMTLQPDAVFLLSDGEFQDATLTYLRSLVRDAADYKRPAAVVHTIGFKSLMGQATLRQIASETGGTYRFVP